MENLWSLGYTPSFPIPVHLFQLFPVLYRPFPIKHSSHHWLLQDQILPWLHSEFWLLYEEYSHLFSSRYSYIFMSLYFASQWENMFLKASNVSLCLLVFKIMPGSGLSNKVGIKKNLLIICLTRTQYPWSSSINGMFALFEVWTTKTLLKISI